MLNFISLQNRFVGTEPGVSWFCDFKNKKKKVSSAEKEKSEAQSVDCGFSHWRFVFL
jgi:hypothetical protein